MLGSGALQPVVVPAFHNSHPADPTAAFACNCSYAAPACPACCWVQHNVASGLCCSAASQKPTAEEHKDRRQPCGLAPGTWAVVLAPSSTAAAPCFGLCSSAPSTPSLHSLPQSPSPSKLMTPSSPRQQTPLPPQHSAVPCWYLARWALHTQWLHGELQSCHPWPVCMHVCCAQTHIIQQAAAEQC